MNPPDRERSGEPPGFVVVTDDGDRVHFLDWGGHGEPAVVLVHGLASTAWSWSPVARRIAAARRVVALDLPGHGLSDAPTEPAAYAPGALAADVIAVAEGAGALDDGTGVVLAGHGFGAIVAAWAAAALGDRCARLVLVDGGLDDLSVTTGMDAPEFLRGLDEPPEVMRSLDAFLADRRDFDPATWDVDQDRAARATIVETAAGRVVPSTRPHALAASVETMFTYRPAETLARVVAPTAAIGRERPATVPDGVSLEVVAAIGHNLMRYRPDEVTATVLGR